MKASASDRVACARTDNDSRSEIAERILHSIRSEPWLNSWYVFFEQGRGHEVKNNFVGYHTFCGFQRVLAALRFGGHPVDADIRPRARGDKFFSLF